MSPDVRAIAASPPGVWSLQGTSLQLASPGEPHMGEWFKLLLQLQGECSVEQGGRRATLMAQTLVLIDGAQPFAVQSHQPYAQVLVKLPRAAVATLHRRLTRDTALVWSAQEDGAGSAGAPLLADMMRAYAARAGSMTPLDHAHATSSVLHLLGVLAGGVQGLDAHPVYQQALAHMDLYLSEADPTTVAAQLGVSRRYLDQVFQRTGQSFWQHLWDRRLAQAAHWLAGSPFASITEVAHATGFKDSSHFARLFRRRYGMSPTQWRQQGGVSATQS